MRPQTFDPKDTKPFTLSRSKLELFLSCQKCFYMDRRRGIIRPSSFPFNLNIAVDTLLKKEFDILRKKQASHSLLIDNGLDHIVPFEHEKIDVWRDSFRGLRFVEPKSNIELTGAVDDIWQNTRTGELIVVDYKSTSVTGSVGIDAKWQDSYKRQVEIYSWLLSKEHFYVSPISYFVYCNALTGSRVFNNQLLFETKLLEYKIDTTWIPSVLCSIREVLSSETIPDSSPDCEYCKYVDARAC